jgi:hypothetical protein
MIRSMARARSSLILISALLLSSCGGGGGGSSAISPSSSNPAPGALSATINVAIPSGSTTTSSPGSLFEKVRSVLTATRKPQYLTSYTQGIDLEAVQNGVASGYVFYALSTLQSNCTSTSSGFSCSLKVMVPVGTSQLVVNTYDGQQKSGSNVLSTSTTTINASSSSTVFSVTTNGVAANINGNTPSSVVCPTIGTASSGTQTYTMADADNGTITGTTIANPWTPGSTDTTGSVSVTPAGPYSAPSGTITFNYNGGTPTNGVAILSANVAFGPKSTTSTALGSLGITPLNATPAGPHYLYIADSANNVIYAYDVCAQQTNNYMPLVFQVPSGTSPTEIRFDRYNWNANNSVKHLFVLGAGNNTLLVIDGLTGSLIQTVSLPGTPHRMVASGADGSGDALFVTVDPNSVLKYGVQTSSPYHLTGPTTISVGSAPRSINLEGFGKDGYVANSGSGTVMGINTSSGAIDATLSTGGSPSGIPGPSGDGACTLVTDAVANTVAAIQTRSTGAGSITQIGSTISLGATPETTTFFPNSNIAIVALTGGTAVLVTCSGGTSFSQTGTFSGLMSAPALGASIPSSHTYPASGPGSALPAANNTSVYIAGANNGVATVQAYNVGYSTPLFTLNSFSSNAVLSGVVTGP